MPSETDGENGDEITAADREADRARRDLERVAFGRPRSEDDATAAREALRLLVAEDAAGTAGSPEPRDSAPNLPEPATHSEPAASDESPDADAVVGSNPPPASRSFRYLPLAIIGFVVVLAVGFALGRALPGTGASTTTTTATHTPNPAGTLFAQFDPDAISQLQPSASSSGAEELLETPQTSTDTLSPPSFMTTIGIESGSLHRILETPNGLTLWVGRSKKKNICMIFTGGTGTAVGAEASCSTSSDFNLGGLSLHQGGYDVSWDGMSFTMTTTG